MSHHHRHITTRTLARLDASLSDRDRDVLASLARVRAASAVQLERLHYPDVTRRQARKSLSSLGHRRLIVRLPRRVGGSPAGSTPFVYGLDVAAQRLLTISEARPRRPWILGAAFIEHTLAVTEVYVRLTEADRAGRLGLVGFVGEPACWRSYTALDGQRIVVKPDAAIVTREGRFEDHWVLELDRATESAATLARKASAYRRYYDATRDQDGGLFPKVLWLVPDARRYDLLVDVIGRQPAETWPLHAVALAEDVVGRIERGAGQ